MMAKSTDVRSGSTIDHNEATKGEALQLHLPSEAAAASSLQHLQVRRHRRSISQLMASMGNVGWRDILIILDHLAPCAAVYF